MSQNDLVFGQNPTAPAQGNSRKKPNADEWINLSFPSVNKAGEQTQVKLGNGIGMSSQRPAEKAIIDARRQARASGREDEFIAWFVSTIIVDFRAGDGSDASEVVVPSFGPVRAQAS